MSAARIAALRAQADALDAQALAVRAEADALEMETSAKPANIHKRRVIACQAPSFFRRGAELWEAQISQLRPVPLP